MVWLRLTYLSLFVTSMAGAVLFLGFTFRPPPHHTASTGKAIYPRRYVVVHLSLATVTHLFCTVYMLRGGGWRDGLTVAGYLFLSATLGVGLWFFTRYDRLGRALRWRLVAVHLSLAVLTFTAMIAALPGSLPAGAHRLPLAQRGQGSSAWRLYVQHRSELAHARRSPAAAPPP